MALNPSTTDEQQNDMTTKHCIDFPKQWKCGSLDICNLFSYHTTSPKDNDLYALSYSKIIKKSINLYNNAILSYETSRRND
ncbi:DUF1643 domain-containing protein [Bacillus paranthracis]